MIDYGAGVQLGPLDSKYNEQIRAWRNDPKVFRWCRQPTIISDVEQQAWFSRQTADPTIKMFSIVQGNALVGVAGFTSIDAVNRRAEFSLYIGPEHQKLRLGRAALETLFNHGFMALNLNVIWGEVFEGNHAFHLFLKLGMIHEGKRQQFYFKDGRYWNADLVSINYAQWKDKSWSFLQQR